MEECKLKIEYRSLSDGEKSPWMTLTTLDELVWDGVFAIRVINDNGLWGLPFLVTDNNIVNLVVKDNSQKVARTETDRVVVQTVTNVLRTTGERKTFTRTRRKVGDGLKWNEWEYVPDSAGKSFVYIEKKENENNGCNEVIADIGIQPKVDGVEIFTKLWGNNEWNKKAILGKATSVTAGLLSPEDKMKIDVISDIKPETLGSIKDFMQWFDAHGNDVLQITDAVISNTDAINAEITRAQQVEQDLQRSLDNEKRALVNGDTIVGLSREVYSRQGKNDTSTFLHRTTAGGTSISDGVASIRQIGGNIVKNLLDGTFTDISKYFINLGTATVNNGVCCFIASHETVTYGEIAFKNILNFPEHKYYTAANIYNVNGCSVEVSSDGAKEKNEYFTTGEWFRASDLRENNYQSHATIRVCHNAGEDAVIYIKDWIAIDLTEMYGVGKEPTKEECDRMFSTMDALPQGLTVAQPTVLKSVGYNQWNPQNIIVGKSIVDNAIVDDTIKNIAVVECLPCKVGAGENNGYVIGYGEGNDWSDNGVEVYLTPLNPFDVNGELYIHKLEKDATYGTYVPQIKGYLLVVTPKTDKLCVHLHWSGDRARTDYEEYIESNVVLPTIPQMSEWGLAGISTNGTMAYDTIDLDRMVYTKSIDCVDLGNLEWIKVQKKWKCFTYNDKNVYVVDEWYQTNSGFSKPSFNNGTLIKIILKSGDNFLTIKEDKDDYITGDVYTRNPAGDITITIWKTSPVLPNYAGSDYSMSNILCSQYRIMTIGEAYYGSSVNGIGSAYGCIVACDDRLNEKTADEVKGELAGVMLYYELINEEEYPIVTKAAPNYIGSDYGTEQFTGAKVPLVANILFYMRSLVSETRNFLDRLMAGLGISDATAVADRIVAVIQEATIREQESQAVDY